MKWLSRLDPATVASGTALWAAINGISLITNGSAFRTSDVYSVIRKLPLSEHEWGALILLDMVLLLSGFRWKRSRGIIALFTGSLWVMYGLLIALGGAIHAFISPTGWWAIVLGLRCWASSAEWQRRGDLWT